MKRFRTAVAIFLAVALMIQISAFAVPVKEEVSVRQNSSVYWVGDEERFASLFADYETVAVTQEIIYAENMNQSNANADRINARYSFDIDGTGPIAPIEVSGFLEEVEYDATLTVQEGTMYGYTEIGNITYKVNVFVQKEVNGARIYAGVTMVPETAMGLEDYIFFVLGEPMVTVDMLPEWFGDDRKIDVELPATAQSGMADLQSATGGYTFMDDATVGFSSSGISGNAQLLEFYYNNSINRACVGVTSNTEPVAEFWGINGTAFATVGRLTIGMRGVSNNIPYIVGAHDIPVSSEDGSDFIDQNFISYLMTILSDVFNIAGSVLIPYEIMMDTLSESGQVEVSVFPSGTDTSVTFDFNKTILGWEEIRFDDAPMVVTFNLGSSQTAHGYFSAYSDIEYFVAYIPATTGVPLYFSVPGGATETSNCYLYVDV